MSLRRRIILELAVLGALTVLLLILVPHRPLPVNLTLALVGLGLLLWNARWTRREVWGRFPPRGTREERVRRSYAIAGAVTGAVLILLLAAGASIGYSEAGRAGALERLANWHILLAAGAYFPWALLQQTLFQFYLLGRLLAVLPRGFAIGITGAAYALVHLPEPWITGVTFAAGIFWTWLYYRHRTLVPLALSHAILGSAFYYWIRGDDLAMDWSVFLE